jgi:uncharacterized protein (DUF58 family)
VRGRALEFADYRPYTPGDDPKLVDWRAFSRLGRLYLKQYEEERSRTLTLLVDASASLDWGEGDAHKGRFARRLGAALAWISLSRHEPVRLFLLRDGGARPVAPTATRAGAQDLFDALGGVRERGAAGLATAVGAALRGRRASGPVVLLTDLLEPDWAEALRTLAGTGEGIALHVLAPDEWEPGLGDEVELEDAETGELRPSRLGPPELAAYAERLGAYLAQVQAECARLQIAHVALNTGVSLQDTVLRRLTAAGILVG